MTEEVPPDNNQNPEQEAPPTSESLLEILQTSLKECQEKYTRLLAESENARKRMQKERHELTRFAVENVLSELLMPLDSFEKALKCAESCSDEVRNWAIGFEMILGQFKQLLSSHGAMEYESLGKHFDPHLHEAVEVVETNEYPPGTIIEEYVRGYRSAERPIRVARVKVSKAPEDKNNNQNRQE
jgi:molecular chaperone GrpE